MTSLVVAALLLAASFDLQGMITLDSGGPIEFPVLVQLLKGSHAPIDSVYASPMTGRFSFHDVPAGTYFIRTQHPLFDDSFEQVEVQRSQDVNITLRRRTPSAVAEEPVIGDPYRVNVRELAIPRAALHHYKKAMALLKSGDDEEAILQLQHAIQIAPDFIEALYPLVDLFCDRGRYPDAEYALAQGISAAPSEVRLHLILAKVLVRQHKYSGALAEVDEYLENLPKDADREAVQKFRAKLSSRASRITQTK